MDRILLFGAFDPLHPGHLNLFQQARRIAKKVIIVVARDSTITKTKKRPPFQTEEARAKALRDCGLVDEVVLGNEGGDRYRILDELEFDALALGYDQEPSNEVITEELAKRGKDYVKVIRLKPFRPEQYKSTFFRSK